MRLTIDKQSPIPRYAQLKRILRTKIEQGIFPTGRRIPAERDLAVEYDVSRITATRAVRDLVQEGLLKREQGRGTFVCESSRTASMNIAFVVADVTKSSSSYYLEMLQGIEEVTSCEGYTLTFSSVTPDSGGIPGPMRLAEESRIDGMILTELWDEIFLGRALTTGLPLVLIDWESEAGIVDAVVVNDLQAGQTATEHLIGLGHRRIGFINGGRRLPTYIDRHAGYCRALEKAGIAYEENLVSWGGSWSDEGAEALRPLIEQRPTAIACAGDGLALDAIEFILQNGLKVPQDISMVGLGGSFSRPGPRRFLTTVRIDWVEMGRQAARRVVSRIRGSEYAGRVIRIDGSLVQRMSCAPPRRDGEVRI